jgi:hypothetical protein
LDAFTGDLVSTTQPHRGQTNTCEIVCSSATSVDLDQAISMLQISQMTHSAIAKIRNGPQGRNRPGAQKPLRGSPCARWRWMGELRRLRANTGIPFPAPAWTARIGWEKVSGPGVTDRAAAFETVGSFTRRSRGASVPVQQSLSQSAGSFRGPILAGAVPDISEASFRVPRVRFSKACAFPSSFLMTRKQQICSARARRIFSILLAGRRDAPAPSGLTLTCA